MTGTVVYSASNISIFLLALGNNNLGHIFFVVVWNKQIESMEMTKKYEIKIV